MKNIRLLALAVILPLASAMAATDHTGHTGAATARCTDREAPATLDCALAVSGAFDAQGRLWLAWAFGGHVYVNRSEDQGKTFSAPAIVNRSPERVSADGENRPKIAVGPQGEVYVSWTQRLDKPYSGHIRFARSVDGGRTFADPIIVNDHREVTSHRFDSLAVNARGDIYLAWLDKRDLLAAQKAGGTYAGAALYFARSTDGGNSFQPNRKIADHSCECCRTAMALDAAGLPIIAWRHIFDDNVRDHALIRFTAPDQPESAVRLSHDQWHVEACPHHGPTVAATDEVIHAAWFNNAPERHGLFYGRSTDGGHTFAAPLPFGHYDRAASHPYVAAVGRTVHLVWTEFDGEKTRIHTMASSDGGQHFAQAREVAATAGRADWPLLLNDDQRVYLSWLTTNEGYRLWPLAATQ